VAKEKKTEESLEADFQDFARRQAQRTNRQSDAVARRTQKEQQQADGTRPKNDPVP
jgi:hypothetical protein